MDRWQSTTGALDSADRWTDGGNVSVTTVEAAAKSSYSPRVLCAQLTNDTVPGSLICRSEVLKKATTTEKKRKERKSRRRRRRKTSLFGDGHRRSLVFIHHGQLCGWPSPLLPSPYGNGNGGGSSSTCAVQHHWPDTPVIDSVYWIPFLIASILLVSGSSISPSLSVSGSLPWLFSWRTSWYSW